VKKNCRIGSGLFLVALLSTTALGHEGQPHSWNELARAWSFEPVVVCGLAVTALLFAFGVYRVWTNAAPGRGISKLEVVAFAGGWFSLVIALVSPLHAWGSVLFSAHMGQHEVLMLIAAPLLVLGRPLLVFMWAAPKNLQVPIARVVKTKTVRRIWTFISIPIVAWLLHAIALWVWHIPRLFEAVFRSDLVHTCQHLSFLLSALLFWWSIIHGPQGVKGYGAGLLYLFTTSLHSGLLGALLSLTNVVWYPSYIGSTGAWGFTPLEDQQLGGLIMWIPASFVYLGAGLVMFLSWMRKVEAIDKRHGALRLPGYARQTGGR
jgi:putative membrane protein